MTIDAHDTRTAGRKPKSTIDDIIQEAWALFETAGYAHTTMTDIAERVGVSRRTLFNYFPCKESLLFPSIAPYMDAFTAKLVARPSDEKLFASISVCVNDMDAEAAELATRFNPGREVLSARLLDDAIRYSRDIWAREMELAVLERLGNSPRAEIKAAMVGALTAQALTEVLRLARESGTGHAESMQQVLEALGELL